MSWWLIVAVVGLVVVAVLAANWLGRIQQDCGQPTCSQRHNPYHSHV